ncbi:hypothetical protein J14TS2_36830 [Bacillus sp. J14TS2]|nr:MULTISPECIES: paeninodin family lasso peptide [unclassified Bacillus (in: firmicutes)]MBO0992550.1 paeninodin family lasso peptide [Bacillus sp. SD088]GIN73208.1 hypothetical protein J14TS2_36830 [Bacillus sp. J14TS2]
MKKTWQKPDLEILDVSMTMKWHNPPEGGGKDPDPGDPTDPSTPGLDS